MRKFKSFFFLLVILYSLTKASWSIDPFFLCGDANADNDVDIQDVTVLINYLFKDGLTPNLLTSDVNADFKVSISDVVYLIIYLFRNGAEPTCAEGGAVKGKIHLGGVNPCCNPFSCLFYECPDQDTTYCSIMNPYQGVKVSAFAQGELVEKTFTDQDGDFYIRLPEGTYDIKIYPPQDYIETFTDIVITNYEEIDLGEPYYIESFVYQQLVVKYGNITQERVEEIMQETGNTILHFSGHNWLLIHVLEEYHPQEMAEILLTNYPGEIIVAEVNGYGCPA